MNEKFKKDLDAGMRGAAYCLDVLLTEGHTYAWQLTREQNRIYHSDIAAIQGEESGYRSAWIDVKADTRIRQTGNVFFETVSSTAIQSPGWGMSRTTEFIAIVDAAEPTQEAMVLLQERRKADLTAQYEPPMYVFRLPDLQKYFFQNKARLQCRNVTVEHHNTQGYLLPLRELEKQYPFVKVESTADASRLTAFLFEGKPLQDWKKLDAMGYPVCLDYGEHDAEASPFERFRDALIVEQEAHKHLSFPWVDFLEPKEAE